MFIHHFFPEAVFFLGRFFIRVIFTLTFIDWRDQYFATDQPDFVEKLFVTYGIYFFVANQLCFKGCALPVVAKMETDVPGNGVYFLFGTVQLISPAEFLFKVGLLIFGERFGNHLKKGIQRAWIYCLPCQPSFVQQGNNGFVGYGLIDGVSIDNSTKFCSGAFVFFEKRRSGHGNETGIGQCFLHFNVEDSILWTVAFVDQNKNIVTFQWLFYLFHGRHKLVDDGGDHCIAFAFEQFYQALTCCGILYKFSTFSERVGDLTI